MAKCPPCFGTGRTQPPVDRLGFFTPRACGVCGGSGQVDPRVRAEILLRQKRESSPGRQSSSGSSRRSSQISLANEIAKLAKLRDQGVLTEQEFQKAKRKLIDE
jgi:DnaJ-class molecular chaperone